MLQDMMKYVLKRGGHLGEGFQVRGGRSGRMVEGGMVEDEVKTTLQLFLRCR